MHFGFVHVGEALECLDDVAYALGAADRFADQRRQVFEKEFEVEVVALLGQCDANRLGTLGRKLVGCVEVGLERFAVVLERAEVALDEAHRIVDFVGDAGGQLANGGHFLLLEELGLGGFQFLVSGGQFPVLVGQVFPGLGQRIDHAVEGSRECTEKVDALREIAGGDLLRLPRPAR